jgi:hypothetical protein
MERLRALKERIEKMSKHHQIEVLRLLVNTDGVCTNENNNGTFINLTGQGCEVVKSLEDYSEYVDEQQSHLSTIENEKSRIEEVFFKDNKDTDNIKLAHANA